MPSLAPSVQVILWRDIFAVVDTGRARAGEYTVLRQLIEAQAKQFPGGIGCLAIIPAHAVPPSDHAREALNAALGNVGGALRCMCWLVEGSGFQGAMVRAILTGLRIVASKSYATHVSASLDEALGWLLLHLPGPVRETSDIEGVRAQIQRERQQQAAGPR